MIAPRYGQYAEATDTGVRKTYDIAGQVYFVELFFLHFQLFSQPDLSLDMNLETCRTKLCLLVLQHQEVGYFHGYIDGVDHVFIDNNVFHQVGNSIYGGNREVSSQHHTKRLHMCVYVIMYVYFFYKKEL